MFSYLATIQYWGDKYFGWQKQPEHISIQETLESVLKKITKSQKVRTKASGRTDAGVHALGQVVRIDIAYDIPDENLLRACNNLLPSDIKLIAISRVDQSFCPQRLALSKEYHYNFFLNQRSSDSQSSIFQDLYIYRVSEDLSLELMQQACELFIGKHDFSHFYCEGTPVKSFVREIFSCKIILNDMSSGFSSYYTLIISGSGFLKQMVRLIMGSIWSVGARKLDLKLLEQAITEPEQVSTRHLAPLAPSKGLLLHHVVYSGKT